MSRTAHADQHRHLRPATDVGEAPGRCPKCHGSVEPTELGNDRDRPAWWCARCVLIVLDDQLERVPVLPERADLR